MKIGLFTSVFFNNIGNGFIDLGAEATIKAAMPNDAEIVKLSQCANFAASMGKSFALKENPIINWLWVRVMQKFAKKLHDRSYSAVSTLDVFSPTKIAKLDYLILPGCILTVPFSSSSVNFSKIKLHKDASSSSWLLAGTIILKTRSKLFLNGLKSSNRSP